MLNAYNRRDRCTKSLDQRSSIIIVGVTIFTVVIVLEEIHKKCENFRWTNAVSVSQSCHSHWYCLLNNNFIINDVSKYTNSKLYLTIILQKRKC